MGKYQKNFGILQKAEILDEEKRIIRLKASDGGFDRDSDRINPQLWRLPGYNPPLVDSHKTSDSSDNRLGEIINAFYADKFYWNDVQLDIPEGDPVEWTDGEKLANRIWKLAKAGKDLRVSVGFIADMDRVTRNDKGGWDFKGQEQTELSIVLMPSNARAGNKQMEVSNILESTTSLQNLLKERFKEMFGISEDTKTRCYIAEIFPRDVIVNYYGEDSDENYFDKYYRMKYTIASDDNGNDLVTLQLPMKEVEPARAFVDKVKAMKNADELLKQKEHLNSIVKNVGDQLIEEFSKYVEKATKATSESENTIVEDAVETVESGNTITEDVEITIEEVAKEVQVEATEEEPEVDIEKDINHYINKKFQIN